MEVLCDLRQFVLDTGSCSVVGKVSEIDSTVYQARIVLILVNGFLEHDSSPNYGLFVTIEMEQGVDNMTLFAHILSWF